MSGAPQITRLDDRTVRVTGRCLRAVDPAHREAALAGSRAAGRYSRAGTPTLYLSSSREGVAAAMIAIDPSRKRPGLWHLTLFAWNAPGAPRATLLDDARA
jgi:RES domain-containing protein